jgi:hypothetical protein
MISRCSLGDIPIADGHIGNITILGDIPIADGHIGNITILGDIPIAAGHIDNITIFHWFIGDMIYLPSGKLT